MTSRPFHPENAKETSWNTFVVFYVSRRGNIRFPRVKHTFPPRETYVSRKGNVKSQTALFSFRQRISTLSLFVRLPSGIQHTSWGIFVMQEGEACVLSVAPYPTKEKDIKKALKTG